MRSGFPLRAGVPAFLAGVLILQFSPVLPAPVYPVLLLPALLLALWLPGNSRLLGWCLAGFCWALLQANLIISRSLPAELEGRDLLIRGVVVSLPEQNAQIARGRTRFEFEIESLSHAGALHPSPGRVRLSAYRSSRPENLHAGQRWQFLVRMKRPHGLMNPGGFDYEGWLFQHRIRATGYIRKSTKNHRLTEDSSGCFILCLRERIRDRIVAQTADSPSRGLLLALAIGERSLITREQWQWLRQTGVSHLVAISGLHVGLVAGLIFLLVNRLWRLSSRLLILCPAPKAAASGAMLAALLYAALAGFSIPTQRALIMLSVVMLGLIFNRRLSPGRTLALALLLILIIDPLAVMSAGFWLSFVAVWFIVYALAARVGRQSKGRQWWRAQSRVTLGLMPVLLLFFQQVSLIAPLANAIAIPLVSLLIAPLCLLGSVLLLIDPDWALPLIQVAVCLSDILLDYLSWLAGLSFASGATASPSFAAFVLSIAGMFWLLAPKGIPARWLGGVMLLPLLLTRLAVPAPGELRFTLLDVGQGLAAVLQTQRHVLVFDTGARFGANFNIGEAVLIPFLRNQGIDTIDHLILSHADNDHMGGAKALLAAIPARQISGSDLPRMKKKGIGRTISPCHAGQQWNWDGVRFRLLHPPVNTALQRNDQSCVLLVEAGGQRLLLSGDIEAAAERELLRRYGRALAADILIAPHHGSRTSSTAAFIDAVSPRYILFPVGYRNRYGFPHPQVLMRYQSRRIQPLQTSKTGAIRFTLGQRKALTPELFRQMQGHYWNSF